MTSPISNDGSVPERKTMLHEARAVPLRYRSANKRRFRPQAAFVCICSDRRGSNVEERGTTSQTTHTHLHLHRHGRFTKKRL